MIVAFILTMPRNNSWNGKWSGDERIHAIVRNVGSTQKAGIKYSAMAADGPYWYDFGDGWAAQVDVRIVERGEAAKLRKKSCGFAGYEWMIESIRDHGKILNSLQVQKLRKETVTA